MDQVTHILETEKIQTIVKIDRQPELIIEALKQSKSLEGRVWLPLLVKYSDSCPVHVEVTGLVPQKGQQLLITLGNVTNVQ